MVQERAALEIVIDEMGKDLAKEKEDLAREKKRQKELEKRIREVEKERETVKKEYGALLDEVHKKLGRVLEEENKSTTTEEHSESEGEDTPTPCPTTKGRRARKLSSSSSGDETEGIEEKVSTFLRNSGDINSEEGREVKSHLQSVKKTIDNEGAGRSPGAKELRASESRNSITSDSERETEANAGNDVS